MAESVNPRLTELLDRYKAAFARGESNPDPILDQVRGEDRRRLGWMIDEFLDTGPRPDPALFPVDSARVTAVVDRLIPELDGQAGALSGLLARRRADLKLTQADLVEKLAADLDASPPEIEKVDAYYHDLEWGSLPAAGLADRVLDSLASILKTGRDTLIEAGRSLGPGRASSSGPVYAREVDPGELLMEMASPGEHLPVAGEPPVAGTGRRATPPDRIDRLFTDG